MEYNINNEFINHINQINNDINNIHEEKLNPNWLIAMCYVPMQEWEQIYDEDTAFSTGTLFPCLNKPFLGGGK